MVADIRGGGHSVLSQCLPMVAILSRYIYTCTFFHSNDQSAEQFCDVLEAFFLHGLKNSKVFCYQLLQKSELIYMHVDL